MPTYSYPGVYIEEIPSGVRTIAGVSTSNTAFVDYFKRGPVNKAVKITSYGDFERTFGGLDSQSEASYAIQQYYQNGGSIAWVVRVDTSGGVTATMDVGTEFTVDAAGPGSWGNNLTVAVTTVGSVFNLDIVETVTIKGKQVVANRESYLNLNMTIGNSRYVVDVVNAQSTLVTLTRLAADDANANPSNLSATPLTLGEDGGAPTAAELLGSDGSKTGMYALDNIAPDIFNIMCVPAMVNTNSANIGANYKTVASFCEARRAFLIVDIPTTVSSVSGMASWSQLDTLRNQNAAIYFPRITVPDVLNEGRARNIGASGTLAGVYARTDSTRGVWKAPAGTDADLRGPSLTVKVGDLDNGTLNVIGVNVLRSFPIYGNISWGGRTLEGADQAASEWKYVPVRRTALYIEESLFQGLKWVVFEPNDEPLWAQIRLNVGAFMHNMFRQAAFQGTSPKEAYFVKCDKETTTQNDINLGIVNIVVGFAPLKPAEFVVIKLQQIAGQVEA
ncbi:MAG: phage tail sheath family protein [Gammaproteobacteria bacterium]|nr:phage tail sheath family protein [Gammaproteobacteria bacterium]MDH5651358.1 phage tail sheath family protein [Gammaproteobacteria bacterium]